MASIDVELLSKATQEAHNGIAIFSLQGKFEWVNKAFTTLTGFSVGEITGKKITEIFEQLLVEEGEVFLSKQLIHQMNEYVSQEIYCKRKDESHFWAKVSFSPIFNEDSEVTHFVAVFTEITEKKELLQKLTKQVKHNEKILSSLNEGYILVDEYANIHDVNPAYCNIVGFTRDELLSMKLTDLRPEMTQEYQKKFIDSVLEEGGRKFETRHKTKDGNMIDLEANAAAVEKDGTIFLAGFVWDITERKKAERQLIESEERWQQLVRNNPLCVILSINGEIKFVNKAGLKLYGADSAEQLVGRSILDFVYDSHQKEVEERIKKVENGEFVELSEQKFVALDGTVKDVEVHTVPTVYKGQNAAQTVLKDITELKNRERELRESQQRFKSLFEYNPHPVYYFDLEGNFLGANKKTEEVSGYPEKELLSMNFAPIIVEDDLERTLNHFESAASGKVQEYEIKIKTKQGAKKDLRVTNFPMKVSDEIVGVFGIAEDITASKKAAEDLKKSEQKWQHLVEDNPQPVQVTIDGEIVFINEAGARLYGAKEPEEVVGMSIFSFSHPENEKKVREQKERLEKGLPVDKVHEHKIVLLNGETRYVEVNSIPIKYQGEEAIQTVIYDITDRKKKESMIEASLIEKEVLLKEIHHRVKNNMAVISGLLELQAMNTQDASLQVMLRESQLRIFSMAMIHEKLYQTKTFADIDFGEYVKELVRTITDTIDVPTKKITVSYKLGSIRLNINQAIPTALLLNEVIVNCFKHAFKDQEQGNIKIAMTQEDNEVTLKVEDDGIGLPKDFKIENQQSLGTTLIQTLSKQLHGELTFANVSKGSGTRVAICFEKDS